eukprot:3562574-Prymnesium_polylepis.2
MVWHFHPARRAMLAATSLGRERQHQQRRWLPATGVSGVQRDGGRVDVPVRRGVFRVLPAAYHPAHLVDPCPQVPPSESTKQVATLSAAG